MLDAYLDIETTGLSSTDSYITVIGVYLVNGMETRLVQLVGEEVRWEKLLECLQGVQAIYTYNGSRFDFPFIHDYLGVNLEDACHGWTHHDLMYDCWNQGLKGGFKAVEAQLCIPRETKGLTGWDAVLLWWKYKNYGDLNALKMLLRYNEEDVVNLKVLRDKLNK